MWWKVFEVVGKSLLWLLFAPFRFLSVLFGGGGAHLDPQQAHQERVTVVEEREAEREAAVLQAQLDARKAMLAQILAEAQSPGGLAKPAGMEPEPDEDEDEEEEQMELERWVAASPAR